MGNIATWLDLAIASARPDDHRVRIHDISKPSRRSCFALSVDERWLHTGVGKLTVFHGIGAALQFLKLAGVDEFQPGETCSDDVDCGKGDCLCLDRQDRLTRCQHLSR